mgnify:FL=1
MNGRQSNWYPDGGHASGRFFPILFAGLMLSNDEMVGIGQKTGEYAYSGSHLPGDLPSDYVHFGETSQAFYVSGFDVDHYRASGKEPYTSADIGLPEWGIRHAGQPEEDSRAWAATYRNCCTAISWNGQILATYLLNAKEYWNNPALFDYQDRYMEMTGQPDYPNSWHRSWSGFTEAMWDTYRETHGPSVWDSSTIPGSLDY